MRPKAAGASAGSNPKKSLFLGRFLWVSVPLWLASGGVLFALRRWMEFSFFYRARTRTRTRVGGRCSLLPVPRSGWAGGWICVIYGSPSWAGRGLGVFAPLRFLSCNAGVQAPCVRRWAGTTPDRVLRSWTTHPGSRRRPVRDPPPPVAGAPSSHGEATPSRAARGSG